MADVKITKKMVLAAIKGFVGDTEVVANVDGVDITGADVVKFVDTQIAQLDNRKAKAAENAEKKRAEGDELYNKVLEVLTDEFQTREQITAALNDEELTVAKVGARLTQMVSNGAADKDSIKIEGRKSKVVVYKRAASEVEE